MTYTPRLLRRLAGLWLVVALPVTAGAYELDTHEQLSLAAFRVSDLASTLQSVFGIFAEDTFRGRLPLFPFRRKTPEEWIGAGARDEDWLSRPLNHFYDPYHDAPLGILGGAKAPDWALEDLGDLAGQEYSYKDARDSFYGGLTARDPVTHERELGHTFYALGHVIHLIQDMAQPQHTRDDVHPNFIPGRESWMEAYIEGLAGAFGLNSRFELAGAPVPDVTSARDLWVTRTGVQMTGGGMAEFSNANFVSAGTNFTELRTGAIGSDYPRPVLDIGDFSLSSPADACRDGAPAPGDLLFYANSVLDPLSGAGLRNERMTTHSIFDQRLVSHGAQPTFALNCFNLDAAADILLPRAVAFSAALLKYFFRGRIEVAPPERFVYGLAPFLEGNAGAFAGLRFKVRNATPNEDAGGPQNTPGQMVAILRYREGAADPITSPSVPPSSQIFLAVSKTVQVSLTREFQEIYFDFADSPLPTNAVDVFLTVVWRGPLGLESDAVLVGSQDLYEPDPVDLANVTDYFCFAGQPYYVPLIAPFDLLNADPALNPQPWRDPTLDGFPDIFGPEIELGGIYTKLLPLSADPFQVDYVNEFDFWLPQRGVAQYARFFVLQDQPAYRIVRLEFDVIELGTSPNISSTGLFATVAPGHVNRLVRLPDGRTGHEFTDPVFYRGVTSQNLVLLLPGIIFVPGEVQAFSACFPSTTTATPPLSRIEGAVAQP
jgi:hypothetical protein